MSIRRPNDSGAHAYSDTDEFTKARESMSSSRIPLDLSRLDHYAIAKSTSSGEAPNHPANSFEWKILPVTDCSS